MPLFKDREFIYWSYRDGVGGTIVGQTAICALRKEFVDCSIVWSHGSATLEQAIYIVTSDDLKDQFQVTIKAT